LYRNPTRIENLNASRQYKKGYNDLHSSYTTATQRVEHPKFQMSLQSAEPYSSHPHSYRYGKLPMFLPNKHSREFREEKSPQRPSSRDLYYVDSKTDSRRDAIGRRKKLHQQQEQQRASKSSGHSKKSPRQKRDLRITNQSKLTLAGRYNTKINHQTRPGRVGWYNCLPEVTEQAIGFRTHVFSTSPFRPNSSKIHHEVGIKNCESRRLHQTNQSTGSSTIIIGSSTFNVDSDLGNDGSSTARRYRLSVGLEDCNSNNNDFSNYEEINDRYNLSTTSESLIEGPKSNIPQSHKSGTNIMVSGILSITPKKVILYECKKKQTFTMRLPIQNKSNGCLAHLDPSDIEVYQHNVFAKLISHPTLLAPKMSAMFVLQVCGIGGDGYVSITFMGKELCRIVLHGNREK
jgi:hypothetical protein